MPALPALQQGSPLPPQLTCLGTHRNFWSCLPPVVRTGEDLLNFLFLFSVRPGLDFSHLTACEALKTAALQSDWAPL